jgi:putative Ca2+/H+ antiporter (TMEM165/GDT1 family)
MKRTRSWKKWLRYQDQPFFVVALSRENDPMSAINGRLRRGIGFNILQELKKKEEELEMSMRGDVESGMKGADEATPKWMRDIQAGILLQAFTMTFLAEWGDRSQITTVVLAAREVRW